MHANRLLGSADPGHDESSDRSAAKNTDDGYQGKGCPMPMLNFIRRMFQKLQTKALTPTVNSQTYPVSCGSFMANVILVPRINSTRISQSHM